MSKFSSVYRSENVNFYWNIGGPDTHILSSNVISGCDFSSHFAQKMLHIPRADFNNLYTREILMSFWGDFHRWIVTLPDHILPMFCHRLTCKIFQKYFPKENVSIGMHSRFRGLKSLARVIYESKLSWHLFMANLKVHVHHYAKSHK